MQNKREIFDDSPDFSLVLGGPLFQLWRRGRLSGDGLELVWRRIIVISLITWFPLLLLSLVGGHALAGGLKIPFIYDFEAHSRFLIALPILIGAELIVLSRIRPAARRFIERGIIVGDDIPKFCSASESAMRVRDSVFAEVTLLFLVYTLGTGFWSTQVATGTASWHSLGEGSPSHLTLAGYWYTFVSIPIFQFILLRWYFRLGIWFVFLWRVSKLNLQLIATHPDRAGGLGFLGTSTYSFAPILFAQGTLLSSVIANRVLYEGQTLTSFRMEAGGLVVFLLLVVLSPLLAFSPHLARARRRALRDYGVLACRYVQQFDGKWIKGGASKDEELLGSGDIQSLADLGNNFEVITETRLLPLGLKDLAKLAVVTAAPLLPLALSVISLDELAQKIIKIIL